MKINPRLYLVIVIVAAVILLVAGGVLLVLPEKNKVSDTEEEIGKVKTEYGREQGRQAQLDSYNKDPEQFMRQISALDGKIPENVDLADVVQQLDYAAEKAGLDFYSFKPEMPVQKAQYYVSTIETQLNGRYFNLVEFYNHIERLPRTVKPMILSIAADDDGLPYLQMTITFEVFFTTPSNVEMLLAPK